jgi:DHA2 family multidrug resistance protein
VLDKGEREDWFGSPTIVVFTLIAAVGLVAMVVWEWRHPEPIIDLRLLRVRSFAVSFVMMFALGLILFGTTVLLPEFVQSLMGYTAQQAGEVLSPGGLVVIVLLPLVGQLLGRVDPRWLVGFGFVANTLSLFYMTRLSLEISFHTAVMMRIYQAVGLAFLFIPINTVSYAGVPREKNNAVSAMMNLARNLGGGVGISLAQTLLVRRAQWHQTVLATHTSRFDPQFRGWVAALARTLAHGGTDMATATRMAYGRVYGLVLGQATVLAYIDTIKVLGLLSAIMIPAVLLLRRPPAGAAAMGH